MTLKEEQILRIVNGLGSSVDLGIPIRNATAHASAFSKTEDGKDALYVVLDGASGEDARLAEVDLDREQAVRTVRLPGAVGAFTAGTASDGSVYVASYNQGGVYRFTPWDGKVESLGKPTPETSFGYALTAGPDGAVYAGTYPGCVFYKFKPGEGYQTIGPMPFEAGESYVRSLAHTECGRYSYVGIGSHARLKRYDHKTGVIREQLLPEKYWNDEFVYTANLVGGKLFVRLHPSNTLLVYAIEQQADGGVVEHFVKEVSGIGSMGVSPEHEGSVYFTLAGVLHRYELATDTFEPLEINTGIAPLGFGFAELEDLVAYPGKTLIGAGSRMGKTRIFKYNPSRNSYSSFDLDVEGAPTDLQCVVAGSDGVIYTGAFLVGGTSVFDPETEQFTEYKGVGQTENIAELGGKMYFSVYPLAKLFEYDLSQPWDLPTGGGNPKLLFDHAEYEQDRPYGLAVGEGKLFIGTICGYGKLGGAILTYDPATGERQVHRNPLPNLSIIALLYQDGLLYGGTTVYGGLGISPDPNMEAKLLVYDIALRKAKGIPFPVRSLKALTAIVLDKDGLLWGMAEGYLFSYNPASESFVTFQRLFPEVDNSKKAVWRDAALLFGKDGALYGTVHDRYLFRYEPVTHRFTVLVDDGAKFLAQDRLGRLYYSDSKTRLRRYTF